jgi:transposase
MHTVAMIYQIRHGLCLRRTCWGGQVLGAATRDNRLFIKAVLWILRTGAAWRDLPPDYGSWSNTHRFIRWRDKGIREGLLAKMVQQVDCGWLMIYATHCKIHPHAAGLVGGNQVMSRTKGG